MTNDELEALTRLRRLLKSGSARAIRLGAGASEAEVAAVIGVTKGTVSRWENGHRAPSGSTALRYLEALDRLVAA